MEWKLNDATNDLVDFGAVTAGQEAPPQLRTLVNTDATPHAVKLRVLQGPGGAAGTGTATVHLNGADIPLTDAWLDCGTLNPGDALSVTTRWSTAASGGAGEYTAEDLAFVEAQYV